MDPIEHVVTLRKAGVSWDAIAVATGLSRGQCRGLFQRHRNDPSLMGIPGTGYSAPKLRTADHPKGWEQGFKFDADGGGEVSSGAMTEGQSPDWGFVMTELKLDPDLYEVVEPVNVRSWDSNIGAGEVRRFWYYKANVIRKRGTDAQADVQGLIEELRNHLPLDLYIPTQADHSMVAVITDWQLAKRDGDGTKGIVARVMAGTDAIVTRVTELRDIGRRIDSLYLPNLGDLMEGCDGQYAMQTFEVELNRRDQERLARHLLVHLIKTVAPHFGQVVMPVTPSNHGENRRGGKAFTSFGDNDDVAVAEQVAEIMQATPDFGHVSFVIANDQLDLTMDVSGTTTTFAHGHQMKQGIEPWWKGQALGRQPAMDSTLLITGHRHHLEVHDFGTRTAITAPALEGGSDWFRNTTGTPGRPGILTLLVGRGHWKDLQVL